MQDKFGVNLRRLIISALFLAIALVMRQFFSLYLPLFGENSMRIGVAGIFTRMPAVLFGPVWGAMVSGLNDVLGFMLRPMGAYLPHLTFTAASGGFLCGLVWLLLRKRDPRKIRLIVLILSVSFVAFGLANWIVLRIDGITSDFFYNLADADAELSGMFIISRWIITRAEAAGNPTAMLSTMVTTFTRAFIWAGILGLLLYGIDILMSSFLKKDYEEYTSIMPLLIAMLVAAWWQSTLNTIVFRNTIWQESLGLLPFVTVWLPRIIQSTITTTVYTYFVALMLGVCKRQRWLRRYLR